MAARGTRIEYTTPAGKVQSDECKRVGPDLVDWYVANNSQLGAMPVGSILAGVRIVNAYYRPGNRHADASESNTSSMTGMELGEVEITGSKHVDNEWTHITVRRREAPVANDWPGSRHSF